MQIAAVTAVALLGVMTVFQVALAAGAPWGAAAWGGRHPGVLPTRLRVAGGVAAVVVYPLLMLVVLDSAEVADLGIRGTGAGAMWVLAGLFGLAALMNLVSPSRAERVWAPVAFAIGICCAVVAVTV